VSKIISTFGVALPQVSCHRALVPHEKLAGLLNSSAMLVGFG